MTILTKLSTKVLRLTYLMLTSLAFIAGLATYNWLSYGKSLIFWLSALVVLLIATSLSYLVKKEIEARSEPIMAFNNFQQILGILIALAFCLLVLSYKIIISRDSDVNTVHWILFVLLILIMIWNGVELYKELKRRKLEKAEFEKED